MPAKTVLNPRNGIALWLPGQEVGRAIPLGRNVRLRETKSLRVGIQANPDRQASHAVIAFPDAGLCYIVEDATQLKDIINKLKLVYGQIVARGQSKIVQLEERVN